ncbi:virulence factor TspB C-terminal domain-related protein [Pseudoxanthomonas sp.]|uniref:virulence factor TspB C-terminal domain-related protein n=1 Tax=Pseudoxanthomonas sp. TaxID=1871049 RepID=UPI0026045AEF|nr:virulence factor TspB C-terminal domain-related protein [Pseudoxanthomonas sp.]WDS36969.1 MAG: virulence factor TspB C-terminal domain-related protein [Pseudoxanthomonas sp.]
MGKDGTCKADVDGDGVADSDADEDGDPDSDKPSFSGGDGCDAPPSCQGDAIACGQARIQWRIDCNTRNDTKITGGACGALPVCTGRNCKADEYAQLIMQWRAACALEKMADGEGSGITDPNTKKIADAITSGGDMGEEGSPDAAFADGDGTGGSNGAGGEAGELDDSGFGWTSSCPTIPDVSVMGQSIHFDTSVFCSWVNLGGQLVIIFATLLCLRIISGGSET